MAKRRRAATRTRTITRTVRAPAPIIRVSAPRAATKKRHHRRRHSGGGSFQHTMVGGAIGGAAYGFIESHYGDKIPTLPFIGRSGTIAIACYVAARKGVGGSIVRDVGLAAAVIAGYQLGSTGHISGDIPSQVRGIAAQV